MTQHEAIIKYLSKHKAIDFTKAAKLGISQFHARMTELRNLGYVFADSWVIKKNWLGEYRCKEYTLVRKPN